MPGTTQKQGQSKGRFLLKRELGRGGIGVVYEALDRERNAVVALKTLRYVDEEEIHRFKKEFRALQGIVHPNLCGLEELIEEDGSWFIVMEWINGVDFLTFTAANDKPSGSSESPMQLPAPMAAPSRPRPGSPPGSYETAATS